MLMETTDEVVGARLRRITKAEYLQLARDGFFRDDHVELVMGLVVAMSPADPAHVDSTERIQLRLIQQLAGRARVRCQAPFDTSGDSLPEPDVFVMPDGDYSRTHPTKAYLVVEVARSSARFDRGTKAKLYAGSDVDEYWVVDHSTRTVVVHRDRGDIGWASVLTFQPGQKVAMLAFPDVAIDVSEILPPSES